MVVRRTCNAKVGGSIPPGGIYSRDSTTASILACHASDRGSIPRRGLKVSCEIGSLKYRVRIANETRVALIYT